MTIEGLLKLSLIDPLEAQVLLAHALKCTRVQLVIRNKDTLSPQQVTEVSALFMRRMQGEPIAYLTGEREFHGLRFEITPDDPAGWLLIEHGYDQAAAVRALLQKAGWQQTQSWKDLAGIERVSGAVLEGNHADKPL
ncbi:MAG: hypothetical protein EBV69_01605 [Oxalobacteraceae bacterium]|nr:hypothetical protein [Oxalobacteraceae bacterium]